MWQRLILRLPDGCARMPAARKDMLRCGDPVCAQVFAPPQGMLSLCVCECVAPTAHGHRASRGIVWQRLILRLPDGCVLGCQ